MRLPRIEQATKAQITQLRVVFLCSSPIAVAWSVIERDLRRVNLYNDLSILHAFNVLTQFLTLLPSSWEWGHVMGLKGPISSGGRVCHDVHINSRLLACREAGVFRRACYCWYRAAFLAV